MRTFSIIQVVSPLVRPLQILCLTLLVTVITGCGGGTSGTDSGSFTRVAGQLNSNTGEPVPNTEILIEETQDFAVSNTDGSFEVESKIDTDTITFSVNTSDKKASAALGLDAPNPKAIAVNLQLDQQKKTLDIVGSEVVQRPTPRPTRTPKAPKTPKTPVQPNPGNPGIQPTLAPGIPTLVPTAIPGVPVPTPYPFIPVNITIQELGYMYSIASVKETSGQAEFPSGSFFQGNHKSASATIGLPREKALTLNLHTLIGSGSILINPIPANINSLSITAKMYVKSGPGAIYLDSAYQLGFVTNSVSVDSGSAPQVTVAPAITGDPSSQGYVPLSSGVTIITHLTVPPSFPAGYGFGYNQPKAIPAGGGNVRYTTFSPFQPAPSSATAAIVFDTFAIYSTLSGIPPSNAIVNVDAVVVENSALTPPYSFTTQITSVTSP